MQGSYPLALLLPTAVSSSAIAFSIRRSRSGLQVENKVAATIKRTNRKGPLSMSSGSMRRQVFELGGWKTSSDDVAVARVPALDGE